MCKGGLAVSRLRGAQGSPLALLDANQLAWGGIHTGVVAKPIIRCICTNAIYVLHLNSGKSLKYAVFAPLYAGGVYDSCQNLSQRHIHNYFLYYRYFLIHGVLSEYCQYKSVNTNMIGPI